MKHPRTLRFGQGWVAVAVCALLAMKPEVPQGAETRSPSSTGMSEAEVLLNLLEQKGLITAREADQTRQELARRLAAAEPARTETNRIGLRSWVEKLDLYGDLRLRFEHRSGQDDSSPGGDHMDRNRWRYRLRAGANLDLTESWRAGIRIETGPGGRSSNVTFGDDSGPWGKDSDRLYLGLLFMQWTPCEWATFTAGRQENPFVTTVLAWDHDLAPEGLSQSFRYRTGSVEWFATFGQFLYDDANPDNPFGNGPSWADAYLFGQQLGIRWTPHKQWKLTVAPLLTFYTGAGDSFRTDFTGLTAAGSTGINDLCILETPVEVAWSGWMVPVRLFGDFAVNLSGSERARAAGQPAYDDEIYAWLAGVELGSARKKGGWSLRALYMVSGLFALDPNLVDSDLFDSRLNMRGVALQGSYALTDFLSLSVTYARAERKEKALPTGFTGDLRDASRTAWLDQYQLFQADLNLRF